MLKDIMGGWKTWTAAGIIGIAAVLEFFGRVEVGNALLMLGAALGIVGLGHKIEKSSK